MKRKLILFFMFVSLFLYFPYTVKARDVSYTKQGNVMTLEKNGNNQTVFLVKNDSDDVEENATTAYQPPGIASNSPIICDAEIEAEVEKYWGYIIVAAPILLIVMVTVDFMKAIVSNDSDEIKKSSSAALKRAIAMFLLFLLPTILIVIFNWFGIRTALCF